ncbi:MAG: hypothetical protein LBF42_04300 [Puniceicoccales bacterium]|jgi:hypothetical protein|nr:hypothetical protein [Puniceicoccales bacterium]
MENINVIVAVDDFILGATNEGVGSVLVPRPGHFDGRHLVAGESPEFRRVLKPACLTRSMSSRSLETLNTITGYGDYFRQVASALITRLKKFSLD